ncbi:MAG: hypothetical protein F6K31_04905 [Symploca sp. SIO2G7]|nr:hypothetical protein [Symploca sp. SIO2G7]
MRSPAQSISSSLTIVIPHSQFPIPHSPFPIPHSPFPIPHSQKYAQTICQSLHH